MSETLGEPVGMLVEVTMQEIAKLVPERCPDCNSSKIRLEGDVGYLAEFGLRRKPPDMIESEEDVFVEYETFEDDPFMFYFYGWFCEECQDKGDHPFPDGMCCRILDWSYME